MAIDLDALRLSIDGQTQAFDDRASLEQAYLSRVGALIEANDALIDLDGTPARLWDLDSVAAYAAEPGATVAPAIRAARVMLHEHWEAWQADALCYVIVFDEPPLDAPPPVGISRVGGDPDLPPDAAWPGERFFVAQLDLNELHGLDIDGALPSRGLLSLFASHNCGDNCVLHFAEPSMLERRATPPEVAAFARQYRLDLAERRLQPRPALMSYGDATDELELPDDVRRVLREGLGLELDLEHDSTRMFGGPDGEDGFASIAYRERPADLYDRATFVRYAGPLTLALQLPFADGFLYLAMAPSDLRNARFDRARLVYWGT